MRKLVSPSGRWLYSEPESGEHVITEDEIIESYFGYWSGEMGRKGADDISEEACIEDWAVTYWAVPHIDHLAMALEESFDEHTDSTHRPVRPVTDLRD